MNKQTFLEKLNNVLFPHYSCPFCGRETQDGVVCKSCNHNKINANFCAKCGEHILDNEKICYICKDLERVFDSNYSCYEYNEETSGAIMALKYNDKKYLAKDFAKILFERFKTLDLHIDIVTSVPMSAEAQKKREYNHAAEIAKEFCKLADLKYEDLLAKIKSTPRQAELGRDERIKNLVGSFAIIDKQVIKDKNILIIDDVFTTGSTMTACATELKKAKPNKVYCLTVTKTKNPEM